MADNEDISQELQDAMDEIDGKAREAKSSVENAASEARAAVDSAESKVAQGGAAVSRRDFVRGLTGAGVGGLILGGGLGYLLAPKSSDGGGGGGGGGDKSDIKIGSVSPVTGCVSRTQSSVGSKPRDGTQQGISIEFRGRSVLHDLAQAQHNNPIGHLQHVRKSMGDEDDAEALVLGFPHHVEDFTSLARTEVVRRLVQNNDLTGPRHCPTDRHRLALPTRELRDRPARRRDSDPDFLQIPVRLLVHLLLRQEAHAAKYPRAIQLAA